MEKKFTPGKWGSKNLIIVSDDYIYIGELYDVENPDSDNPDVEVMANLKLIVAAPELLEVCEKIILLKDLILPPKPVRGVSEEFINEYKALSDLLISVERVIKQATE
jgi:hypothetical protein